MPPHLHASTVGCGLPRYLPTDSQLRKYVLVFRKAEKMACMSWQVSVITNNSNHNNYNNNKKQQ